MKKNNILLIIAARKGSKGVKNKNIRELCGKPLIAHTILQAKKWGRADNIVCSTDSNDIADIAQRYGAAIHFMRPAQLARDTTAKMDVLRHALKTMEAIISDTYRLVIDLDVTAPIRKISDIEGAYRLFIRSKVKSVFSVTPCRRNPYFNMVERTKNGYVRKVKQPGSAVLRRQDAPAVYDMNASIYVYDRNFLLNKKSMTPISDRSKVWVMDELSAFDIDHETDFKFIEFLVSRRLVKI